MPAQSQTVTVAASYTAAPDISLPFEPDTLMLRSEAGSFFFSFDGVNNHGRVIAADPNLALSTKRTKVWLKQDGGAATARISAFTVA